MIKGIGAVILGKTPPKAILSQCKESADLYTCILNYALNWKQQLGHFASLLVSVSHC